MNLRRTVEREDDENPWDMARRIKLEQLGQDIVQEASPQEVSPRVLESLGDYWVRVGGRDGSLIKDLPVTDGNEVHSVRELAGRRFRRRKYSLK